MRRSGYRSCRPAKPCQARIQAPTSPGRDSIRLPPQIVRAILATRPSADKEIHRRRVVGRPDELSRPALDLFIGAAAANGRRFGTEPRKLIVRLRARVTRVCRLGRRSPRSAPGWGGWSDGWLSVATFLIRRDPWAMRTAYCDASEGSDPLRTPGTRCRPGSRAGSRAGSRLKGGLQKGGNAGTVVLSSRSC